ncbi:hypothetical protein CXF85_21575 [Colwellia sp. 75C3]|nr:hypothetical protein CXF85_21575 [Colwellia sp. 75C3]
MARQGKDAEIYENANGDYIITFKDGQGNEHARQLTESEVNERKANIANQIKSKLPNVSPIDPGFGIDPIEVVLPPAEPAPEVPTRGQWVAEKKAEIKEKLGNKLPTPPTGGLPPVVGAPDWIAEKKAEIRDKFASNIPTEPRHDNGDTAKERMAEFKNQGSAKLAARIEEAKNSNQKDTNPVIPAPEFNFNDQYQDMLTAEIEELDTKMDSVMASTHAINNARPFLSGAGKTSIGLGMGYAGDEGAVAVGIAHAFTESWSASMTMNVTTGDHSEVSSGAGVQFQF